MAGEAYERAGGIASSPALAAETARKGLSRVRLIDGLLAPHDT
jgi:hypothetical protein